jgi:hypothetical protein
MVLFKTIADEADDAIEAAAYIARISADLMGLVDRTMGDDESDDGDETLQ